MPKVETDPAAPPLLGLVLQDRTTLGVEAVAPLLAVFDDQAVPHAVKLKAAAVVFGNHPTYLQTTALADRIAAIEAAQDGQS